MILGLENLGFGSWDLLGPNTSNLHQRNTILKTMEQIRESL